MTSIETINQPGTDDNRSYHDTNAPYALPNDNIEHERLEAQAEHLRDLMNGRVIHAPLNPASVRKALDIGCGTGIVTDEIAARYPKAQVYGLDLSPVPKLREKLPNIDFIEGDFLELSNPKAQDRRFEHGSFDLIFSRLLVAGLTDWKGYVERCAALTRPGGFVEMHDLDMTYHSIPPGLPPSQRDSMRPHTLTYPTTAHPTDSWISPVPWLITLFRTFEAAGMDATCGRQLPRLFHEAGLEDVQATRYAWPTAYWNGQTDAEKRMTHHYLQTMGKHLPALMRKLGSRQNVVSAREIEDAVKNKKETTDAPNAAPSFVWFNVVRGRKVKN